MTLLGNAVPCKSTAYCGTYLLMYHLQGVEKFIHFVTFLSYMLSVSHASEMFVTIFTSTTLYWYNVFSSIYSQVHF
jgi:hypothetical protein